MVDENIPPVVAIVTTHNPGPWFEDCLASLADQDYPGFAALVVDAGSDDPIASRVAAVTPNFFVLPVEDANGYSAGANRGAEAVEGAAFYLICHDDVILEPDAVRKLVANALQENAAVAGPKLVSVEDRQKLLHVGLDVDKFAAPVRRVSFGELDQSQYDETHETFAVPGACKLVRSDLFRTLGGFDEKMTMFGEDIDFCWRAHLAGARVIVVPAVRVAHREATASRQKPLPQARSLQWRHELRAVLKNYSAKKLPFILAQFLILSVTEVIFFLALGRRQRVKHVLKGWQWNIANISDIRIARKEIASYRIRSDREVAHYFIGGGTRAKRFIGASLEKLHVQATEERSSIRHRLYETRAGAKLRRRDFVLPLTLAVVIILVGSRSFLVGNMPLYSQWLPVPSPFYLLAHFFGGIRSAGAQSPGPASPAYLLLAILGLIFFGSSTLAVKTIVFLFLFLGAYGVSRLVARVARGMAGRPARVAAALAYIFLPLYFNDVALGRFEAIVCYGLMPFIFLKISDILEKGTYAVRTVKVPGGPGSILFDKKSILGYFTFGLLLAVGASFAPIIILLTLITAVAMTLAAVFFDNYKLAGEVLVRSFLSVIAALIILLPWSITFFQSGLNLSVIFTALPGAAQAPSSAALLRFDLGPVGYGWLGYAMDVAALVALLVARRYRFLFASRLLVVAIVGWTITFCFGRGWFGLEGGDLSALLVIPAIAVAAIVGLSLDAILADLPGHNFGWRQMITPIFTIVAFGAILPVTISAGGGRWSIPNIGYDSTLSFFSASPETNNAPGILWVGNPAALPLVPWQVSTDLAAGVTAGNLPNMTNLWPSTSPGFYKPVLEDLTKVQDGEIVNYGSILASHRIKYVVALTATVPILAGVQTAQRTPMPSDVITGLANQLDLQQLPSEGGALVFKTREALARPISLPGSTPSPLRILLLIIELLGIWFLLLLIMRRRRQEKRKERHIALTEDRSLQIKKADAEISQRQIVSTLMAKYKKDTTTDQEISPPDSLVPAPVKETGRSEISEKGIDSETDIGKDRLAAKDDEPIVDKAKEAAADTAGDQHFDNQAAKKRKKNSKKKSGVKEKNKIEEKDETFLAENEDAGGDDGEGPDTSEGEGKKKDNSSQNKADADE